MDRQELLARLDSAWTAICLHEQFGDVVGALEYWQTCSLAQLNSEWQKTVADWPEFI